MRTRSAAARARYVKCTLSRSSAEVTLPTRWAPSIPARACMTRAVAGRCPAASGPSLYHDHVHRLVLRGVPAVVPCRRCHRADADIHGTARTSRIHESPSMRCHRGRWRAVGERRELQSSAQRRWHHLRAGPRLVVAGDALAQAVAVAYGPPRRHPCPGRYGDRQRRGLARRLHARGRDRARRRDGGGTRTELRLRDTSRRRWRSRGDPAREHRPASDERIGERISSSSIPPTVGNGNCVLRLRGAPAGQPIRRAVPRRWPAPGSSIARRAKPSATLPKDDHAAPFHRAMPPHGTSPASTVKVPTAASAPERCTRPVAHFGTLRDPAFHSAASLGGRASRSATSTTMATTI